MKYIIITIIFLTIGCFTELDREVVETSEIFALCASSSPCEILLTKDYDLESISEHCEKTVFRLLDSSEVIPGYYCDREALEQQFLDAFVERQKNDN